MNKNACSNCHGTTVDVVKTRNRVSGYQIIRCPECKGTGFKPGTKEYQVNLAEMD